MEVVSGDRKIHNSSEWQNSTIPLYLQQVIDIRFFIKKAAERGSLDLLVGHTVHSLN